VVGLDVGGHHQRELARVGEVRRDALVPVRGAQVPIRDALRLRYPGLGREVESGKAVF
jgi:hypothetical protein